MDKIYAKEFSQDEKLFAYFDTTGKLKIWDIEKNVLIQEFVPNLHLSAPCTSLKWITLNTGKSGIKKKLKTSDADSLYILFGTGNGCLAMYSYSQAKIEKKFNGNGHTMSVTSIAYDGKDRIYTSGLDSKIIVWSLSTFSEIDSFTCRPGKPTSIAINENRIITAAKAINVWDSKSFCAVESFTGHSSNVFILKTFTYNDDIYLISCSKSDRGVCLWKLINDGIQHKSNAIATFSLNNTSNCLDFIVNENILQVVCITRSDSLQIFELNLDNLKSIKPIKPKYTVEFALESEKNIDHIPIIGALIINDKILVGYGELLLQFETISIEQKQENTILVRKDPMKKRIAEKSGNDVKGLSSVQLETDRAEYVNTISSKKQLKPIEIPLETRIENLKVGGGIKPNAKKMTQQLIQGLHSQDIVILRNVLKQKDEETVRMTVKYLPSQYVLSLVNELTLLMSKNTSGCEIALIWLRNLIETHASHLMAFGTDNLNATFGTCLGVIDQRAQNLNGLSRIRGRLDLLVRQIKKNSDIDDELNNENVLVYDEDDEDSMLEKSSSSDEDNMDEFDDADSGTENVIKLNDNAMELTNGNDDSDKDESMDVSD